MKKGVAKQRLLFAFSFKTVILLSVFLSILYQDWIHVLFAGFMLVVSFLPQNKLEMPSAFEILLLVVIYISLYLGQVDALASQMFGRIFLQFIDSIIIAGIGMLLIILLNKGNSLFSLSAKFVALFSFSFAIAIGTLWELFESTLFYFFRIRLDIYEVVITRDLGINVMGAFFVAFAGYMFLKNNYFNITGKLVHNFVEKNPTLFTDITNQPKYVKQIISEGENEKLEFKQTLKTNVFTKEPDKKIEHAVLKTIVAYLNTKGGTLLVGVSDRGEITGIEQDEFKSNDKFYLHFTNLLKQHIGNEYIPFIKSQLIAFGQKTVLKVDCKESGKQAFLRFAGKEEFYIRLGPSSVKLEGSKLVDYVQRKFKA